MTRNNFNFLILLFYGWYSFTTIAVVDKNGRFLYSQKFLKPFKLVFSCVDKTDTAPPSGCVAASHPLLFSYMECIESSKKINKLGWVRSLNIQDWI